MIAPDRTPELDAAIAEVRRTFATLRLARARSSRCRRSDSRAAAYAAELEAERAYLRAADERDRLVTAGRAAKAVPT